MVKKQTKKTRQRICNAYHEAGHAVVGHVLGRIIKEVTIAPSVATCAETPEVSGYCEFDVEAEEAQGITQWGPASDHPHSIAVMLAGAVAYVRLCHERGWGITEQLSGTSHDVQAAEFASMRMSKTELGRKRLFNREERRAIEVVTEQWEVVEAVAEALLTHGALDEAEVSEIIEGVTESG
jgi:ATP-dependent Zn protease